MSSINNGEQTLIFDFRQEATSLNFNKLNANIVKSGIYKGGRVSFIRRTNTDSTYSYQYIVEPFTATFFISESTTSDRKILVNVTTNSDATIPSTAPMNSNGDLAYCMPSADETFYLVMELTWVKTINNYVSFSAIDDISKLSRNQLYLCKLVGNGANKKPSIYYDYTSYGSYYESFDHKFITYESGHGIETSDGIIQSPQSPRKFIPFSSDSYTLNFNQYGSNDYYYVILQPFCGELEMVDISDYTQKVKFIFNINGNLQLTHSAKMKLINNNGYIANYLAYYIDEFGRLKLYNGFSSVKKYNVKMNLYNNSRVLNTTYSYIQ